MRFFTSSPIYCSNNNNNTRRILFIRQCLHDITQLTMEKHKFLFLLMACLMSTHALQPFIVVYTYISWRRTNWDDVKKRCLSFLSLTHDIMIKFSYPTFSIYYLYAYESCYSYENDLVVYAYIWLYLALRLFSAIYLEFLNSWRHQEFFKIKKNLILCKFNIKKIYIFVSLSLLIF